MPALPPGPSAPSLFQSIAWWNRPLAYLERARARHGKRFTIRLLGVPPFVMLSDPADIKELFTAPPDVLHPGEGAQILEPVVGSELGDPARRGPAPLAAQADAAGLPRREDGDALRARRRGDRARGRELAARHADRAALPGSRRSRSRSSCARCSASIRAAARGDPDPPHRDPRDRARSRVSLIPQLQRAPFGFGPWGRFDRLSAETDALIYELIEERRAANEDRDDVLSMLLEARHEDGSPMSDIELRDELMTLLVAGHETTASSLAWAFERIARTPRVAERLAEEADRRRGRLRHRPRSRRPCGAGRCSRTPRRAS